MRDDREDGPEDRVHDGRHDDPRPEDAVEHGEEPAVPDGVVGPRFVDELPEDVHSFGVAVAFGDPSRP